MKKYLNLALTGLLLAPVLAIADDVDLFVGTPANATEAPNVLIILDNTANWEQPFTNEMAALSSVISALPENKFRVGLMMFTESGGGNSGNDGAYVRAAIRPLSNANKPLYQALVNNLDKGADKSNGGKISKAFEEAYLYFSAGIPHSGNEKKKTDYTGNTFGTLPSTNIYALTGNALLAKDGNRYTSPIVTGCAKNFVIYISNGAAQDNSNDISQATSALAAAGGSTSTIAITPSGSQDNVADEWARFMKKSSQAITTYTVDIDKKTTGQGPGWTALLKSAASVSSGKYFDVTSSGNEIANALTAIFSEIQSVNSVFASVSLPVSVNTQGTYLNQVYVGMFRPDSDAFPRWDGNLKQYKLGVIDRELKLQDADSKGAIDSDEGFITNCARSFWTPDTLLNESYWGFSPRGDCLLVPGSDVSDYPDGNIVEKGAQGYMLRHASSRTMKTCDPSFASCTELTNFNDANTAITPSLLGAANTTERADLINWAIGANNKANDSKDTNQTAIRPSVHADVVHSRPVAINYGTDAAPQVVVFYGSNDGLLKAVNGNRTASIGLKAAGSEIWSFMAPEFYSSIKRLRDNSTTLKFPGHTTGTPTPLPKAYGFDGAMTAYTGTSSKWLYATMRRGGRVLYAFDVTNAASPVLKWKKGCPTNLASGVTASDTDCTAGFTGLGQTWSTPKVFKATGYGSGASPILMMGGGYDPCEDSDPQGCTSSTKGNKVYVLDADSGTLLHTLDTDRSVVGDVTIVPDLVTGLAKYAYLADLGGNVYRIDIGTSVPSSWGIAKIASLGCDDLSNCTANRKFMFGPDVVLENGEYILLLGSGDREKPLTSFTSAVAVSNHFFMIRDKPSDPDWLESEEDNCTAEIICKNSLLAISTSSTPAESELANKKGWYLPLGATEQVVTSAITVFGIVTFSTHMPAVPTAGQCSNLGVARVYNVSYVDAEGVDGLRSETISGGGLPPSPVAGMVTLDDGSTVPFVIGANPDSPLEGSPPIPPTSTIQPKARVYWNIEQ